MGLDKVHDKCQRHFEKTLLNSSMIHTGRHDHVIKMETFSALLALCAGNSPVTGEFPAQKPVKRSFDVFFDLRLNKRLSKKSWGWWFETPSRSWCRHCNDNESLPWAVMTWKRFPHHWSFVIEIQGWPVVSHHKGPAIQSFALPDNPDKLLDKQSWCRWFDNPSTLM